MKTKSFILFALFFALMFNFCTLRASVPATIEDEIEESEAPNENEKAKIWIGPKIGTDLPHFTSSTNAIANNFSSNYQFGLLCQIGEKVYVQPEILYSVYKKDTLGTATNVNFLKIPVMVGWKMIDLGLFSLHVMGGPQLSFKLNDRDRIQTGTNQLLWQVGAGVDVLQFITLNLRYTLQKGLNLSDQIDSFNPSNSGLNLTVGLKLR